jgi:hypothetical protein
MVRGAEALGAGGWERRVLDCGFGCRDVGCDEGLGDFDELHFGSGAIVGEDVECFIGGKRRSCERSYMAGVLHDVDSVLG